MSVFYPNGKELIWIRSDGRVTQPNLLTSAEKASFDPVLLCHHSWSASAAGFKFQNYLDILELYAFVRPARFVLPTPVGLAQQLGLSKPKTGKDMALALPKIALNLLEELQNANPLEQEEATKLATMMETGGWSWGPYVLRYLKAPEPSKAQLDWRLAAIWEKLPDHIDYSPSLTSGNKSVHPDEALARLSHMLGNNSEVRPSQAEYTSIISANFAQTSSEKTPALILAEAGTGTGKTLGYLAPATLWAEKNTATVWVSTYTRALQHQISDELTRLYSSSTNHNKRVVIRKGRENYLCLLNFEETLTQIAERPKNAIVLGLMARWIGSSKDGDLTGTDFPAWMLDLFGSENTVGLADRRGECIHSACAHYNRCFVERSIRTARQADIVIANHALTMNQATDGNRNDLHSPTHYVFDEGHHVFEAADATFAEYFSAQESAELRKWIRGSEGGKFRRARGLKRRLENIVSAEVETISNIEASINAALMLPGHGWEGRVFTKRPIGVCENFFVLLNEAVYENSDDTESVYNLQQELHPATDAIRECAENLVLELDKLITPLSYLKNWLSQKLEHSLDDLENVERAPAEGIIRGLELRVIRPLNAWQKILSDVATGPREEFIDWIQIKRFEGQNRDVGIARHWLDPSIPFAKNVLEKAKSVVITSATLGDRKHIAGEDNYKVLSSDDWKQAITITGTSHIDHDAIRVSLPSPFKYEEKTRIFVVNNVDHKDPSALGYAMARLMCSAKGGGLGLFTAIRRLRGAYPTAARLLSKYNLPLFAQHIDNMNLQMLLAMFREDPESCLLGTDAVRDGIDVPGKALRLIVFDRVPWPRNDILFNARAQWQGRNTWTEYQTKRKLRQAFGRLIRQQNDRGVFVLLDKQFPTRFTTAFPPQVNIIRADLSETIDSIKKFFSR